MIDFEFSLFIEKTILRAIDKQITSEGLTIINTKTNEKKSVMDDFLIILDNETIPLDDRAFNLNKPYNWSQNNLFKVISRGIKQATNTEDPLEKIENDIQNYFSQLSEEQRETVKEYTLKDYEENGFYIFQNPHKAFTFNSLIDDVWQQLNEGHREEAKKHSALLRQNTGEAFGLSQAALLSFTAKSLNDVLDLGFDYTPDYETNRVSDKTIEILNFSTYSLESRCLIREADPVYYEKIISSILSQMLSISKQRIEALNKEIIISGRKLISVNFLNTIFTTKQKTLDKLKKTINSLETRHQQNPKNKKTEKQLKYAEQIFEKCSLNFPENFRFTLYEFYAIFGALFILHENEFIPTEFYFIDIVKALGINPTAAAINKKIKEALLELCKKTFPCYIAREREKNKFEFYDQEEPLFEIKEIGLFDFSPNIKAKDIKKQKLILSLKNIAVLRDVSTLLFYSDIKANIFSKLQGIKRVQASDIYLICFVIKERRFKNETKIDVLSLCNEIKREDLIDNGSITRDNKYKLKKRFNLILSFLKKEKEIKNFSIKGDEIKIIHIEKEREIENVI